MGWQGKLLIGLLIGLGAAIGIVLLVAPGDDEAPLSEASPTSAGSPTGGGSPSPVEKGLVCTDQAVGFEITFPADWHAIEADASNKCKFFDPEPIDPPANGELDTAVTVLADEASYEDAIEGTFDAPDSSTVRREEATVAGNQAVRYEVEHNGQGFHPAGVHSYGYIVNHDGFAFVIVTSERPGETFEAYKRVVDDAANSLRFL